MFLAQLRAILRASRHGRVRILLPMVAHVHEVEQALAFIRQAKQQLDDKGVAYDKGIEVGGMIEIPAAALALPMFMKRLDFLSLGTNDLIQYTLAIDRTDDAVAHLYDPLHPAVLHLVAHVIQTATRGEVPVAVCGEMAGDLALTRLLLGFGLRNFSMHPAQLPAIKERVLRTSLADGASRSRRRCCARATRRRRASCSPSSIPEDPSARTPRRRARARPHHRGDGALRHADPRRLRRRRGEGRVARGRHHALRLALPFQGHGAHLPQRQPQQARHRARPEEARGARGLPRAREAAPTSSSTTSARRRWRASSSATRTCAR